MKIIGIIGSIIMVIGLLGLIFFCIKVIILCIKEENILKKERKELNVKIHEFDERNNPYGLYVAGIDLHRPPNSTSLGKIEICSHKKNK